jgi:hypothetical protein
MISPERYCNKGNGRFSAKKWRQPIVINRNFFALQQTTTTSKNRVAHRSKLRQCTSGLDHFDRFGRTDPNETSDGGGTE